MKPLGASGCYYMVKNNDKIRKTVKNAVFSGLRRACIGGGRAHSGNVIVANVVRASFGCKYLR